MPTYRFACDLCGGGFEQWMSIHHDAAERPTEHPGCGGTVKLAITRVATYGVGDRGRATREADQMDRKLDLDRPAYKRFRDAGHQPRSVVGAHRLEALAANDWEVKTGGMVSVPDDRKTEIDEMLAAGAQSDWSPIEEVHHRKKAKASA